MSVFQYNILYIHFLCGQTSFDIFIFFLSLFFVNVFPCLSYIWLHILYHLLLLFNRLVRLNLLSYVPLKQPQFRLLLLDTVINFPPSTYFRCVYTQISIQVRGLYSSLQCQINQHLLFNKFAQILTIKMMRNNIFVEVEDVIGFIGCHSKHSHRAHVFKSRQSRDKQNRSKPL